MKIGENLSIYMDGMPLEGNVVLSCVQQDGLGHVSCLPFEMKMKINNVTFCSAEGGPRSPFTESQSTFPLVIPCMKFRSP